MRSVPATTATTLVSPSFSRINRLHLRFAEDMATSPLQLRRDDSAFVEVSTNGSTWTTLQTQACHPRVGSGFVPGNGESEQRCSAQVTVFRALPVRRDLGLVLGLLVDNVIVNGTGPCADLGCTANPSGFTSTMQNPTGVSVAQNTTYTVVATAPNGCTATNSVAVERSSTCQCGN